MGSEESIDRIQGCIQKLLETKDSIVEYLNRESSIKDATREMWISDVKETYYNCFAAYQMLIGTHEKDDNLEVARRFLKIAESRSRQCLSELKALRDEKARELELQLQKNFESFSNVMSAVALTETEKTIPKHIERIVKVSDDEEYRLPCSVCGKIATVFKITDKQSGPGKSLRYDGITRSLNIDVSEAPKIFAALKENRLNDAHDLLEETIEGGLDAYCPFCDKIYCREDYNVEEEWDAGFYDDSYGTCPNGHRRLIDD